MVRTRAPLQLLVTNLDYDEHKGRICIGRVTSGKISKAESIAIAKPGARCCGTVVQWPNLVGRVSVEPRCNRFAAFRAVTCSRLHNVVKRLQLSVTPVARAEVTRGSAEVQASRTRRGRGA